MNNYKRSKELFRAGMLLALAVALPLFFHLANLGSRVFLPMHIPIIVAGLTLNPSYAFAVGALAPLLSSVLTGLPVLLPTAIQMLFELGILGAVLSFTYRKQKLKAIPAFIISLLCSRLASALSSYLLLNLFLDRLFSFDKFLIGAFVTALPGLFIQLLVVSVFVKLVEKNDLL